MSVTVEYLDVEGRSQSVELLSPVTARLSMGVSTEAAARALAKAYEAERDPTRPLKRSRPPNLQRAARVAYFSLALSLANLVWAIARAAS